MDLFAAVNTYTFGKLSCSFSDDASVFMTLPFTGNALCDATELKATEKKRTKKKTLIRPTCCEVCVTYKSKTMSDFPPPPIQEGLDDDSMSNDSPYDWNETEQEEEEPETLNSLDEDVNEEEKGEATSPTEWYIRSEVTESEDGGFTRNNSDIRCFTEEVKKIRKDTQGSNYESIASQMLELLDKDKFCHLFEDLRRMYEFIIRIHNKYSVKLNKDISDEVDRSTAQMMQSALRKYTEHFVTL